MEAGDDRERVAMNGSRTREAVLRRARFTATTSLVILLALGTGETLRAERQDPDAEVSRERWQRTADVIAAMNIRDGATVADVGAGGGFLTVAWLVLWATQAQCSR